MIITRYDGTKGNVLEVLEEKYRGSKQYIEVLIRYRGTKSEVETKVTI